MRRVHASSPSVGRRLRPMLCRVCGTKVHLPLRTAEVPVLPSTGGWRQWAFEWAHDSPLAGHVNAGKTFDKLRRCVVWERMLPDCEFWVESCSRCAQHRREYRYPWVRSWSNTHSVRGWTCTWTLRARTQSPTVTDTCAPTRASFSGYPYSSRAGPSSEVMLCKPS